jgi:DNA-binding transcriptional LysR family regulator
MRIRSSRASRRAQRARSWPRTRQRRPGGGGRRVVAPATAVEAALATLAEELHRLYPGLEARVHRPDQKLPAGAVRLPAVRPDDPEAILDAPAGDGGRDDDPLDQ